MIKNQSLVNQAADFAYTQNGEAVSLAGMNGFACTVEATVSTPSAEEFLAGESEVTTLTFDTQANTDAGDYVVIYDTEGLGWAVAADLSGEDEEPTGAVWTAIPAGRKAMADISAASTAAEVAAAFELAFDGLTDVPFATDDSADDGTMIVTVTPRGPTTDAEVHNEDDSGAGSIAEAQTNQGVASTVDVDANTITIEGHGFAAGLKGQLTTTGTLPAGLSLATDYFVLVVDEDTIQLSASLNGAAVNITDQGTDGATHTFTATALAGASVKLQRALEEAGPWFDIADTSNNITVTADFFVAEKVDPMYGWVRSVHTMTAGQLSLETKFLLKGE